MTTLAPSFLIGSSSFLQATRTLIKSQMGSKLDSIRQKTYELAALERLEKKTIDFKWEKRCDHSSTFIFQWIFIILAGNKVSHKSLDGFEFRQVSITDFGVSCPCACEKSMNSVVTTLAPSFLIGSSSFLQATRTPIKSRMGSKLGSIRRRTYDLTALERV